MQKKIGSHDINQTDSSIIIVRNVCVLTSASMIVYLFFTRSWSAIFGAKQPKVNQSPQQWRGRWTCTRICRFLVVGNIFRLETCMNSLVFQIEFSGKKFLHPKLVYYYFKSRLLWNYDYLRPSGYWPGCITMSPQHFIESIEIDGKGPLSHVEDGPFEIHPTLSPFKSNIFELKKIYLIYKTLARGCWQYRLFGVVFKMAPNCSLNDTW